MPSHSSVQAIVAKAIREHFNFGTNKAAQHMRRLMADPTGEKAVDDLSIELANEAVQAITPHVNAWGTTVLDGLRVSTERHNQIDAALDLLPKFPGRSKAISVVKNALDKAGAYRALPPQIDQGHAFLLGGPKAGSKTPTSNYPDPQVFVHPPMSNTTVTYSHVPGIYHFEQTTNVMIPVFMETAGSYPRAAAAVPQPIFPPDIDINVSDKDRQKFKDLLAEKFGKNTRIIYDTDSITSQRVMDENDNRLANLIRNNLRRSGS